VALNGTTQYLTAPYSPSLNLNSFTASAWVNLATAPTGNYGILSTRFGSDDTFDMQFIKSGSNYQIHGDIGNGSSWLTTAANYTIGTSSLSGWNMITYTVNSSGYTIYLNGTQEASGSFSGTPEFMKPGQSLILGMAPGGGTTPSYYLNGSLDEANVFGGVLSSSQVASLYNNSSPISVGQTLPASTPVLVSTGGTFDLNGSAQSIGSLNVSSGGTVNLGIGNVLNVGGSATLAGTLNLSTGTVSSLPETLMTYSSETGAFNSSFGIPAGDKLSYTATALQLVVAGPSNLTWNNAGATGTWDTVAANWNNGTGSVTYGDNSNTSSGDIVTFSDNNGGTGNYSVTVSGVVHPTSVTFANNTGNYTLTGANSSSGIAGTGSLTLLGTGTVTLSSSNTYTGGTNVSAGKLVIASATAYPNNGSTGTPLTVGAGAVFQIASHTTGGTSTEPIVSSLTNNGSIDITNNEILIKGSTYTAISTEVSDAYNPATGGWNTSGNGLITSSTVGGLTTVGVAQVSGGVLVKATYYGDANLDGLINSADYTLIDGGFLSNNTLTGWQNGDFNYDGVINGSDYTLIDNAFNMQGAQLLAQVATPTAQIAGGSGTASAVPEPTTLGLLGLGAMGLLGRRNRRRK
jgi:autotransporter-associated beta strand protein